MVTSRVARAWSTALDSTLSRHSRSTASRPGHAVRVPSRWPSGGQCRQDCDDVTAVRSLDLAATEVRPRGLPSPAGYARSGRPTTVYPSIEPIPFAVTSAYHRHRRSGQSERAVTLRDRSRTASWVRSAVPTCPRQPVRRQGVVLEGVAHAAPCVWTGTSRRSLGSCAGLDGTRSPLYFIAKITPGLRRVSLNHAGIKTRGRIRVRSAQLPVKHRPDSFLTAETSGQFRKERHEAQP